MEEKNEIALIEGVRQSLERRFDQQAKREDERFDKQDLELKSIDTHLGTLNGTVAKHERELSHKAERLRFVVTTIAVLLGGAIGYAGHASGAW